MIFFRIDILFKYLFNDKPRVIVYHSVIKDNNPKKNKSIHQQLENFIAQINYIINNYNIVSLDSIHRHYERIKPCKKNSVAITVDDGFSSFYKNIYPLVKSYNFPIAIAISCDRIDDQQIPWDVMLSMIMTNKEKNIQDDFDTLVYRFLNMNSKMRKKFINKLKKIVNEFDGDPFTIDPDLKAITYEQIEELKNDKNISFISHGLSHDPLNALEAKVAKEELIGSKKKIEKLTNRRCLIPFLYYLGVFNQHIFSLNS